MLMEYRDHTCFFLLFFFFNFFFFHAFTFAVARGSFSNPNRPRVQTASVLRDTANVNALQ